MKSHRLSLFPLTLCLILSLSGCNKTVIMDLSQPEETVIAKNVISNDSSDPFQNLYSFHFKIGDDTLFLSMTYGELLALGWSCGLKADTPVLGSLGVPEVIFSKGGDSFSGTLLSTSDYYVDADQLVLTSVTLSPELSPTSDLILPKHVVINQEDKHSLAEKIGEPQDMADLEDSGTMWLYSYDIDENITFIFDQDEQIKDVTMTRYIKNQTRSHVPAAIANYSRTDILSDDLSQQTFEVDGVVYKMPTPVEQWMENGYDLQEAFTPLPGNKMLEPGDSTGCNLVNGNMELYVIIENFNTEAQTLDKCYVTRLTLSSVEGHTIKISPQLGFDTTTEDLQNFLSAYENTQDKNTHFTSITLPFSERISTAFYTDTTSGKLEVVEYLNFPD